MSRRVSRGVALALAVMVWYALVGQFMILVRPETTRGAELVDRVIEYFTFFTNLTNLLVALALTVPLVAPLSGAGRFFLRPGVITVVASSIIVVALGNRFLVQHGEFGVFWWSVPDLLLHNVIPALFVVYWWVMMPRDVTVRWAEVAPWLLYPVAYFAYIIAAGAVGGDYPYAFLDVTHLGYPMVMVWGTGLGMSFVALTAGLLGLQRWRVRVHVDARA